MSTTGNGNGGVITGRFVPLTVTADSEAEGYEIDNAFTLNPTQSYKSTANTTTINMTFNPVEFSGWGIINHNLTTSASI